MMKPMRLEFEPFCIKFIFYKKGAKISWLQGFLQNLEQIFKNVANYNCFALHIWGKYNVFILAVYDGYNKTCRSHVVLFDFQNTPIFWIWINPWAEGGDMEFFWGTDFSNQG